MVNQSALQLSLGAYLMNRRVPSCPSIPSNRSDGWSLHEFDIRLITPMFGGGVAAKQADPMCAVRVPSIRGHLQFWWRATVGADCSDHSALRSAHTAVWGDTQRASRVRIRAQVLADPNASSPKPCAQRFRNQHGKEQTEWAEPFQHSPLPYALFPFQGSDKETPASYIHALSFKLRIECHPDIRFESQVEPALRAWVNFGGLGSRTRRGCGALHCQPLAPQSFEDLSQWFSAFPSLTKDKAREWPTLPPQFLIHPEMCEPIKAWKRVIGLLRDFRQKAGKEKGVARSDGPSRSWFPEPDTIRRLTSRHSNGHHPNQHLSGGKSLPDGFPRAEFGLPIVFQFREKKEPDTTILKPIVAGEIKNRMSSPLLLRPLAIGDGKQSVPMIMRLNTLGLSNVALCAQESSERNAAGSANQAPKLGHSIPVASPSFVTYDDSPLRGLTENGSALDAFMLLATLEEGKHEAHPNTGYKWIPS